MMSIDRILCPSNLPFEFDETLSYAVSLARAFNAKLIICHCTEAPAFAGFLTGGGDRSQVRKLLEDSVARHLGSASSSQFRWEVVVVKNGDVGEDIVRTARELCADLIVMRSRRSRLGALLGSKAEQVSRTASCPVLVVHPKDCSQEARSNGGIALRHILLPHDFSSSSELALSYALSLTQKFKAELHLLHVLPQQEDDEPEIALDPAGLETVYYHAIQRLQASVPENVYRNCSVINVVRWGKPYREILAYARGQDIELVCMGALGKDFGLGSLFGSNVDRVLRQAPCPVLVARPLQSSSVTLMDHKIGRPDLTKTLFSWLA